MSTQNRSTFNLLLTSAIAQLYQSHPVTIRLDPSLLWAADTEVEFKRQHSATADGTVAWLYRNGIVSGNPMISGGDLMAVTSAQLTAHGYRIANTVDSNSGGATLGQIAIEAAANPSSPDGLAGIELVARRFTEGA